MADAVDTADSKPAKNKKDEASPIGNARKRWAKEAKDKEGSNPVVETFYELSAGHKLLLCKRRKSGTVHRTLIGSTEDKRTGANVKMQLAKAEKSGNLRTHLKEDFNNKIDLPPATPTED